MAWNLLTKRRDDLPEMRWPLVVLTMAVTCLAGGGALALWEAAPVLTIPFLVLAVVSYTLLILLWRRLAALAVSAGVGAFVILSGGGWFPAVCCALSLLAVAYVYATLFIARESRFVRIASTASAIGVCLLLTAIAWISWRFGTVGEAVRYFCEVYRDAAGAGLQSLYASGDPEAAVILLPETISAMLGQVVVTVPALAGMACILLAGVCDGLIRFLFWLLDCSEYFAADGDDGITIPRSFGVMYGTLLFLVMSTNAAGAPHLYSILSNCHWIFALPCAWVGLCVGYRKLRMRLAEASLYGSARTHSPLPTILLMLFIILLLGLSAAFTLLAVLGAVCIIGRKPAKREE